MSVPSPGDKPSIEVTRRSSRNDITEGLRFDHYPQSLKSNSFPSSTFREVPLPHPPRPTKTFHSNHRPLTIALEDHVIAPPPPLPMLTRPLSLIPIPALL